MIMEKKDYQIKKFLTEKIKQREIEIVRDKKKLNKIYRKYNIPITVWGAVYGQ